MASNQEEDEVWRQSRYCFVKLSGNLRKSILCYFPGKQRRMPANIDMITKLSHQNEKDQSNEINSNPTRNVNSYTQNINYCHDSARQITNSGFWIRWMWFGGGVGGVGGVGIWYWYWYIVTDLWFPMSGLPRSPMVQPGLVNINLSVFLFSSLCRRPRWVGLLLLPNGGNCHLRLPARGKTSQPAQPEPVITGGGPGLVQDSDPWACSGAAHETAGL